MSSTSRLSERPRILLLRPLNSRNSLNAKAVVATRPARTRRPREVADYLAMGCILAADAFNVPYTELFVPEYVPLHLLSPG